MSRRSTSRSVSLAPDDKTMIEDATVIPAAAIKEEGEEDNMEEEADVSNSTVRRSEADSMVEELLSDGDE